MKSMNSLIFLLLAFTLSFESYAQISITSADVSSWYAIGKGQLEIQKSNDPTLYTFDALNPSTTLSQAWVLPAVQYTDTFAFRNTPPGSTPYTSSFSSATHARILEISAGAATMRGYVYLRLTNDSVYSLGTVVRQTYPGVDTTMYDSLTQLSMKLPVTIGTVLPTTRDSSNYGPGNYEVGINSPVVDAFGTITLPNGMFSCLRIKESYRYYKHTPPSTIDTIDVIRYLFVTKEGHQASVTCWRSDLTVGSISVQEVRWTAQVSVPTNVSAERTAVPSSFQLPQNYPNPFNPSTTIRYELPTSSRVRLSVYDVLGREVAVLVDGEKSAGSFKVSWDATRFASGVYFYQLRAGNYVATKKTVLLR